MLDSITRLDQLGIFAFVGLLVAIAAFAIGLVWRWLDKRVTAPSVHHCAITPQLGFNAMYVDISADETLTHAFAFPTIDNPLYRREEDGRLAIQAPVFEFSITNHSGREVLIRKVFIQVIEYSSSDVDIRDGPLRGGTIARYGCEVRGGKGLYPAAFNQPGLDFLSITPNSTEAISIYVRSRDAGGYRMQPVFDWTTSWKSGRIDVDCGKTRIFFFANEPPTYIEATTAKH